MKLIKTKLQLHKKQSQIKKTNKRSQFRLKANSLSNSPKNNNKFSELYV